MTPGKKKKTSNVQKYVIAFLGERIIAFLQIKLNLGMRESPFQLHLEMKVVRKVSRSLAVKAQSRIKKRNDKLNASVCFFLVFIVCFQ